MPLLFNAQRKFFLMRGGTKTILDQSFVTFYSNVSMDQSFVTFYSNILLQIKISQGKKDNFGSVICDFLFHYFAPDRNDSVICDF